jgi:murein DD-endopeptidase MepM/ murein hydrolase activator NlpD
MSSRSGHQAQQRAQGPKPHASRAAKAGFASRFKGIQGPYTLAHAGRQFRLGPLAFWAVASGVVAMALWSAGTATYFAFRDDLLTRLISRQADMQYAYEDRITELRAQIDRLTSRQLLDQEQVEQRIETLVRRQQTLDSRAQALSALPDLAPTGSVKPAAKPQFRQDTQGTPKPSPISDTVDDDAKQPWSDRGPRGARLDIRSPGMNAVLSRVEESLERIEQRQAKALAALEESIASKAQRTRGILTELGVDLTKVAGPSGKSFLGGPLIPIKGDVLAFERQLSRIQDARAHLERLNKAVQGVPVRKPLAGDVDMTSGFGVRMDPFIRAPAMHSGLDFRASTGEPVRATAGGKVSSAGWQGGYGKMVEIDHGNGFTTRYGHLSEILVEEDQAIKPGQIIGRVGSTGRSTGPHLHYETRIDGDAVDPHKFLRAGMRLSESNSAALQR